MDSNEVDEAEPVHTVSVLSVERRPGCPFDPPEELIRAHRHGPISRCLFPGGRQGWLVTGYDLVRSVLADSRFVCSRELTLGSYVDISDVEIPPAAPGEFTFMDESEHSRYRKLLAGQFTVRRMRMLTERVEQVTADHLDVMEKAGPPTDLVTAFAEPVPAIMLCELLGVPYEDRGSFKEQAAALFNGDASAEEQLAGYIALREYLAQLVAAKRAHRTDDVLGDLTDSELTDEELTGASFLLLAAGLDTTSNMLAFGTFALLSHPGQWAALHADPTIADKAVEELMRYLSVAKTFVRIASEDIELGGQTIAAGTTVIPSLHTANRDPERFPRPDTLDIERQAVGHLGFGHGRHQCPGQQLARVVMRVAFPALVNRFPTLRLDVPPEEIVLHSESADVFGVHSLPVAWDV
ncbi:cytochrome P450 [Streptomyces sp. NPDC001793]|uniref:cytochrome P450 n=1 Tax=Streptomyces sp. NPDC001793 TaxID=3154657 RepID=UPI0033237B81